MNDTEVTKLFAELGISNQQAATLRTILLPEARVLLDEFMISKGATAEEIDTASAKEEVVNQDLPSIEEGAPSCDDKVSTTDTRYKSDDIVCHDNHAKEEEDIQESEHTATLTEEVEDDGDGGVTVDLYEFLIKISGEDATTLRPVLHPKARELLDELVSEGSIESAPADDTTLVEEGALTVDLYDLLVQLNIEDATHLLPALHIKARELLEELISNGTITKKETVSPTKEVAAADQNKKTSKKASSPTSIADTPNEESGSDKLDSTPNSTSTNLEEEFKEKCTTKRSNEVSLNPPEFVPSGGYKTYDPNVNYPAKANPEPDMARASSEVLRQRRIVKVSRHSQKFGGGRGSGLALATASVAGKAQLREAEREKERLLQRIKQERLQEELKNEIERQSALATVLTGISESSDPIANALPKGSAWVPDTQREERSDDKPNMNPSLGNTSNNTSSQGEDVEKQPTKMDDSPFSNILTAVGIPLLSYLTPRELFCLSLTNHYANTVVNESLFDVYHMQHQHRRRFKQLESPVTIDDIDSTIDKVHVDILDQHTFTTRERIVEDLLDKVRLANLRYHRTGTFVCTDTLEVTMEQVVEDISDLSNWLHADGAWYGTFRSDPNEIWKDPSRFSVGCRMGEHGQKGRGKRCWIDYLLRTVDQKRYNSEVLLQREWARIMIAQRGMRGREWQFKCNGVEGVGYMIYKPSPHDEDKAVQDIVKSLQGRNPDMLKDNSALRQIQAHIDEKLQQIEIRFISVTPAKPANSNRNLLSAFGM